MLNVYTGLSDAQYISPDYRAALEKWTRKGSMYKGLKAELFIASTYKTEGFRKAYTEEYCKIYSLTPRQSKMMMDDQIQAANDYDDFLCQWMQKKNNGIIFLKRIPYGMFFCYGMDISGKNHWRLGR